MSPATTGLVVAQYVKLLTRIKAVGGPGRLYDKEVANELSVSIPTVKTHISHIFQKLDVGNRRAAADKARELGLIK